MTCLDTLSSVVHCVSYTDHGMHVVKEHCRKSDAQAHASVSGRQLQHALASAVAVAGTTLSAKRESWKLGPPQATWSSPDTSLTARGQHIRKVSQRGVLVCDIPTPYHVILTCARKQIRVAL